MKPSTYQKIVTVGDDCHVSLALFTYLSEKYKHKFINEQSNATYSPEELPLIGINHKA